MPVNTTAIAQIADLALVSGQAGDIHGQASVDSSFKDLLSIGIDRSDEADKNTSGQENANSEDKERYKRRDDMPVQVVAVELPVTLAPLREEYKDQPADAVRGAADKQDASGKAAEQKDSQESPLAGAQENETASPLSANAQDNKAQASQQDNAQPVDAAAAPVENNTLTAEEKLRADLAGQFEEISEILGAIIDRMSGVDGNDAASKLPENVAALLPAAALQNQGGNPAAIANIALLKGLQSIIQQLQQALTEPQQPVENGQTPAQEAGNNKIMSLLDALNRDLSKLSALLTPVQGEVDGESQSLPAELQPSLGNIRSLLQDNITNARLQLKQLASENESIYSRALSRFQAQLGQANVAQMAGEQLTVPAETANPLPSVAANTVAAGTEDATNIQPSVNVTDKSSAALAPQTITAAPVMQENTSNNNSSNNGQNNSSLLNGVAATASGQTTASSETTFSRIMSQLARPVPEQVMLHIKTAIADGSSKIQIKLDPEELGKLDIRLDVKSDGRTGVVITADNSNTLNLLQKDAQNLLRALSDAGLQTDSGSLSFNLRGEQQDQGQGNSQMASNYQKAQPEEDEIQTLQSVSRNYVLNVNDGLDIII